MFNESVDSSKTIYDMLAASSDRHAYITVTFENLGVYGKALDEDLYLDIVLDFLPEELESILQND